MTKITLIAIGIGVLAVVFAVKLAVVKITGNSITAGWTVVSLLLGLMVFGVAIFVYMLYSGQA